MNDKLFKLLCESGFILEAVLKLPEPKRTEKLTRLLEDAVTNGNLDYSEKIAKYLGRKLSTEELMKIREKLLEESKYIDSFLKVSSLLGQKRQRDDELEKFLARAVSLGLLDESLKIAKRMVLRDLNEEEFTIILEKHKEMEEKEDCRGIYNSQKTAEAILNLIK